MSQELMDLQRSIREQGYAWTAGPTSLSALSPEQQKRRLGLRLIPEELARIAMSMAEQAPVEAVFPPAWDWRNVDGVDWTTPIRDQQACGSCVAFGTVAVLEIMLKRHQNDAALQPDLSEAHLFFCGCGNCCDTGWWPSYALNYAQAKGVPDEVCFPYQDRNLSCSSSCADWRERVIKVTGWQEVLDVGARKEWLATKGPMIGCMAVYRDFFSYTGGVYRYTSGGLAGYHAVGVIGYSEVEQCWLCKNSWGMGWGEAGWFKIGYGECGLDSQFAMYGVEDVLPPGSPPPAPPPSGCNVAARLLKALRGG
ncbi:MAG: C1 family peptidase [Anaerolineae bacterium]